MKYNPTRGLESARPSKLIHAERHPLRLSPIAIAAATALWSLTAGAAPQGGNVVAGQVAITQRGATTNVAQSSQRAIVDWRSFSVGATETVNFQQPNAASAILNRVTGNDASAIYGRINANGQVYLVNPNGIFFSRSAQVNAGGLMASTSNIANGDFMNGKLSFTEPGKPGATVVNEGTITIGDGGFAALVGPGVSNSGVINARFGKVALASGDAFVLDLYGDKLISIVVDANAMARVSDASGVPLAHYVDHSGNITAIGGTVQISAGTARDLVDSVINVSGVVKATAFETTAGHISLLGGAKTNVALSGSLDASGPVAGDVKISAANVDITSSGRIDASAGAVGHGGSVNVWSDAKTTFDGTIAARGGSVSGDGGQVEVSSAGALGFTGSVDAGAANGQRGNVLLDPRDLTIAATGSPLPIPDSTSDVSVSADAVRTALYNGANVTLAATRDLAVNAAIDSRAATGAGNRGDLSLSAGRNLGVNSNIIIGNGKLTLQAGDTFTQAPTAVIATLTDTLKIGSINGLSAQQLLSNSAIDLQSTAGRVTVAATVLGVGTASSPTALTIKGATGVSLLAGARVAGGPVVLSSTAGSVGVGGTLDAATSDVVIGAGGTGRNDGASLGSASVKHLTVGGAADGTGTALGFSTLSGSVLVASNGMTVRTSGAISLLGKISSSGAVDIASSSGSLAVGAPLPNNDVGIRGVGATDITLAASTSVSLYNALVTGGGAISVSTTGTLSGVGTGISVNKIQTNAGSGASGSARFTSTAGNIVFFEALGGANTGYTLSNLGYQAGLKPTVGSLVVRAPGGSVVLNGLNLDGNDSAVAAGNGLDIQASRIISNAPIGVNKGAISLVATGDVLFGSPILQRGYDASPTCGAGAGCVLAYPVTVSGSRILLWDDTSDSTYIGGASPTLYRYVQVGNAATRYTDTAGSAALTNAAPLPGVTVSGVLMGLNVAPKSTLSATDTVTAVPLNQVPNDLVSAGAPLAPGVALSLITPPTSTDSSARIPGGSGSAAAITLTGLGTLFDYVRSSAAVTGGTNETISGRFYSVGPGGATAVLYPGAIDTEFVPTPVPPGGPVISTKPTFTYVPDQARTASGTDGFATLGPAFTTTVPTVVAVGTLPPAPPAPVPVVVAPPNPVQQPVIIPVVVPVNPGPTPPPPLPVVAVVAPPVTIPVQVTTGPVNPVVVNPNPNPITSIVNPVTTQGQAPVSTVPSTGTPTPGATSPPATNSTTNPATTTTTTTNTNTPTNTPTTTTTTTTTTPPTDPNALTTVAANAVINGESGLIRTTDPTTEAGTQPERPEAAAFYIRMPVQDADLGRQSSLNGSTSNVFVKDYGLVSNRNDATCVPKVTVQRGKAVQSCAK